MEGSRWGGHGDSCLLISMPLCNPLLSSVDWTYQLPSNTENAAKSWTSLPRLSYKHCDFCLGVHCLPRGGSCMLWGSAAVCQGYRNKVPRAGGFNKRHSFSHSLRGLMTKIKVLGGLVPLELSLVGLPMAAFSLCPHRVFPLCEAIPGISGSPNVLFL